jgi:hypothetical protein
MSDAEGSPTKSLASPMTSQKGPFLDELCQRELAISSQIDELRGRQPELDRARLAIEDEHRQLDAQESELTRT